MSCPNCKLFHAMCKAQCCAFTPLPRATYFGNFDKQQRPVKEILEFGNDVIPATEDGHCTFLTDTFQCAIYNQRPEVCIKFGDETHINMTCAFQTKEGHSRPKKETKRIAGLQEQKLKQFLTNNI